MINALVKTQHKAPYAISVSAQILEGQLKFITKSFPHPCIMTLN